jgi:putative PIN family toxin of toxin-antitoxin system
VRVVLDTNVFISGIFFSGPPHRILEAWKDGRLQVAFSHEILDEYQRVGAELERKFKGVDLVPFLQLLLRSGRLYRPRALAEQVCDDPDDDKFLACALVSRSGFVISGDKHLLRVSGYRGIEVVRPRRFVEENL